MRIVHVVRQYYPSCGGLEDVVRNLVLAQKFAGRDVSVVTLDTNFQTNQKLEASALIDGVQVQRIGYIGSRRYSIAPAVRAHLADADIVHVHAIDFFIDYLSLLKRRGKLPARLVVSTHGGIFHTRTLLWLKQLFFRVITPFSLKQADAVIASSYADKVLFEPIARHTTVIENGVSLKKFGAATCSTSANGFLYIGRFSDNKNLLNLVRWFAAAYRRDDSLRLYIAGRADSAKAQGLIDYVRVLDAEAAIRIVPDPSDSDICALIERCRFAISASTYEGFGLSVPELMSYGLVPVLSDIPSFRHFVERAGFGALFEFNEASFGSALQAALVAHAPEQVAQAEQFAGRYAWAAVARQFAAVYDA